MNGRAWTEDECHFLEDKWGIRSVQYIAGRLGRTAVAVQEKAKRLGLGRATESSYGIPVYLLVQTIYKYNDKGTCFYKTQQWLREGLPTFHKKFITGTYRLVNIRYFWKWAEQHKRIVDFTRMRVGELGPEPKWMKEKRRIDLQKPSKWKRSWNAYEDGLLYDLCKPGITYNTLTERIPGHSELAIRTRIYKLGLEPPVCEANRKWTQEEVDLLQEMYAQGYRFDAIGARLHRSAKSCQGKLDHMNEKLKKMAEVKE